MIAKQATFADIVDLLNWLELKLNADPDATYNPGNSRECLVCQYLRDRGFTKVKFFGERVVEASECSIQLPNDLMTIAYGHKGSRERNEPFSAAHQRAVQVMSKLEN